MGNKARTARSSKVALCREARGRVTQLISLVALSVFFTSTLTPSAVSAQEGDGALEVVELGYSLSYPELLMSSDVQSNTDLKQETIPGGFYGLDGFLLITPSDHSFEIYITNSTGNLAASTGLVNLGNNTTAWAEVACFYNADSIYRTTTVEIGAYSNNGGYPGTLLISASGTFSLAPGGPLENCIVLYNPSGPVTAPSSVFLATSFTTDYGWIGLLADSNGPRNTVFGAFGVPYYNATWQPYSDDVRGLALYAVVEDASCTYSISPTSQSFGSSGGSGSFNVNTQSGCAWTSNTSKSWIHITGGSNGTGNGTVSYTVDTNSSSSQRSGTIQAAGKTFNVTQSGAVASCTYSISPTSQSLGSSGGSGSFNVNTQSGCVWTSNTSKSWIHITGGSNGTGNGTVSYTVDTNSSSSQRSGTIQAAGKTFTINQEGAASCSYTISPTSRAHDSDGGTGTVSVSTTGGCTWTASRNTSWITITSGSSGTGNGTVSYRVDVNSNTTSRTGTMTIAGERFTVTQAGSSGPPPSGENTYYAVIAHSTGALDSMWVSSTSICNSSSSSTAAVLTYQYGNGNSVEKTVSVPASGIVEWQDTASDLFGVTGNSSGVVDIVADAPLLVAVRTFNSSDTGTFGQSLPGITVEQSVTQGETGIISPVKRTPEFRTNIGFINTGQVGCTVETIFINNNGSQIGDPVTMTLQPGEWIQKNDILKKAGVNYAPIAYAVITVNNAGATVWAYATVIDNATGDPTGLSLTTAN